MKAIENVSVIETSLSGLSLPMRPARVFSGLISTASRIMRVWRFRTSMGLVRSC